MYNVIKSVIESGGFKLSDMQRKIKKLYVMGDLTEAQMGELFTMANGGANADAERPEVMDMLKALYARMDALEARMSSSEGGNTEESEAYPAWEPWNGISDNYQYGAIVSHGGKLWRSVYTWQNVWEPGAVGDGFWVEVEEV